jgi:hypothetical protein
MTDETRENLDVRPANSARKRQDYPEVRATARQKIICICYVVNHFRLEMIPCTIKNSSSKKTDKAHKFQP